MSDATLRLLAEAGFAWAGSGEGVLANSLQAHRPHDGMIRHCAFRVGDSAPRMFFRDDALSDLIGFTYRSWHGDDAASDFVNHLQHIARAAPDPSRSVVSIIMDGENAWDHYPNNGYFFLKALYERLAAHPELELTTFSACLDAGVRTEPLGGLVSGSWIYGNLSTWIGSRDKNRAWDLLVEAKRDFDGVVASGRLGAAEIRAAQQQLAICEGSDWFWWFGDYNDPIIVREFDALYRRQLAGLYRILGREAPAALADSISEGGADRGAGGVMLRSTLEP